MAVRFQGGQAVPVSDPKVQEARMTAQQIAGAIGDMEAKARVLAGLLDNMRRNGIRDANVRERVTMKAVDLSDEYVTMRQAMTRFVTQAKTLTQGMDALVRTMNR